MAHVNAFRDCRKQEKGLWLFGWSFPSYLRFRRNPQTNSLLPFWLPLETQEKNDCIRLCRVQSLSINSLLESLKALSGLCPGLFQTLGNPSKNLSSRWTRNAMDTCLPFGASVNPCLWNWCLWSTSFSHPPSRPVGFPFSVSRSRMNMPIMVSGLQLVHCLVEFRPVVSESHWTRKWWKCLYGSVSHVKGMKVVCKAPNPLDCLFGSILACKTYKSPYRIFTWNLTKWRMRLLWSAPRTCFRLTKANPLRVSNGSDEGILVTEFVCFFFFFFRAESSLLKTFNKNDII